MNYDDLLERAEDKISKETNNDTRFKIPEPKIFVQGKNTMIKNFSDIADFLDRDEKHLLKFLSKQLAASGETSGKMASFLGKFRKEQIDKKIKLYLKEYVFCPVCGKPDTKLVKESGVIKMKCEACGSKRFVKKV